MEERDKVRVHSCRKRKRTVNPQVRAEKISRHQQSCDADNPAVPDVELRSRPPTPVPDFLHALALRPPSSSPHLQLQSLKRSPQHSTHLSQALESTPSSECTPDLTPDGVQQNAVPRCDAPLMIHGYSVEEYQAIYHSVVDDMLKYKSGRLCPYTLKLGRKIKQRLWERLGGPKMTETETPEGLVQVEETASKKVYPPLIDVDISLEPDAWKLFKKNAKHKK